MTYGDFEPPRHPHQPYPPPAEEASILFVQPFLPGTLRLPDRLTLLAKTIHLDLRQSLLYRIGYNKGITALQQWLLIHILTGREFDIVDLFICELEEVIYDGMTAHRQQPFAHWISYILAQLGENAYMDELQRSRTSFKEYSPLAPRDGRCGPRGQRLAQRTLDERAVAEGRVRDEERAVEDADLDEAEAQLPGFLAVDTDDLKDDEDYTPTISVP